MGNVGIHRSYYSDQTPICNVHIFPFVFEMGIAVKLNTPLIYSQPTTRAEHGFILDKGVGRKLLLLMKT